MSIILCLETSAKVCSVALFNNRDLLAEQSTKRQFSHAETLMPMIAACLEQAKVKPNNLRAIAVSSGPGSYTGLRIGLSAAKGLCHGLGIPLISVETLSIAPHAIDASQYDKVISMQDARRMEVYVAIFDGSLNQIVDTEAKVIDTSSFQEFKDEKLALVGDGVSKCVHVLTHLNQATFFQETFPSAKDMGAVASAKYGNEKFEDLAYFTPYYLKNFIAGTPKKLV